jgi:hypothetical protein
MLPAIKCATVDPPSRPTSISTPGRADGSLEAARSRPGGSTDGEPASPDRHHCFYRTLAEDALDIITVVDEFGTIVYTSPSSEQ